MEVAKAALPPRGACSPSWAEVYLFLCSPCWPRGAVGRGWQLPQGGLCVCSPPSLLCPLCHHLPSPCSISCCYGNGSFQGNG